MASLCLVSYCASAYAKEVVVTGRGATMGLAHSDASRNAVEKALGVHIRSETRVKNHQLISDKILSIAEGYIRKLDFLEGGCKAGSCFVQIRADVDSVAIKTALIKNHIEVIDGEQTYARVETAAETMRSRIEACRDEVGSLKYPRSFVFVAFNYQIYPDADREGYAILELSNILARSAKLHLLEKWYEEAIRTKNRRLLKELAEHGFPSVFTGPFDPIGASEYPVWTLNVELYDKKGRIIKKLTTTRDYDYHDENVNLLKTHYTYKTGSRECVDNGINCIQSGPWPAESSNLSDRRYSVPMSVIRKTHVIKAIVESPSGEKSWAWEHRLKGGKDNKDTRQRQYNKAAKKLTASEWYEEGLALHRKGKWDKAIVDYNKALELNPQYTDAYYNRGICYYKKDEYDKAIADYKKVLELDPQYANAYYGLALTYEAKGEHDKAIADYNKVLELNPQDADGYCTRGIAYGAKGEYDKAIADYNKALELNPQYAYAYKHRGNAYRNKGEYDKAIADYYKAVWWEPQDADAYYNRGVAYKYKGEYESAIADFNKVLELDPQDAYAYKYRGNAYSEKGEYDRAIADFNNTLKKVNMTGLLLILTRLSN
jgi:tetratricopeptide (TPR) repeat protein